MATLGLVNIGALATGVLASPRLEAEAILVQDGRVAALGAASKTGAAAGSESCRDAPRVTWAAKRTSATLITASTAATFEGERFMVRFSGAGRYILDQNHG